MSCYVQYESTDGSYQCVSVRSEPHIPEYIYKKYLKTFTTKYRKRIYEIDGPHTFLGGELCTILYLRCNDPIPEANQS